MNRLKLILFLEIIAGLGSRNIQAQTDSAFRFSLIQAQEFAIDHFFVSKNAALDIEIAKKKIMETTAIGLPQVSAGINYTHIPDVPVINFPQSIMGANKGDDEPIVGGDFRDPAFYSMVPGQAITMGEPNNVNYNVMLTQLIFSGEYLVGLQATKTLKTFNQENFDKVKIDLREGIASTYYGILILIKNRGVLVNTLENLKATLGYTTKFHEQGLVDVTDVDQLSLTVKRTENSLRNVDNQIAFMQKMLKYQLGIEANNTVELTDNIDNLIEINIINPNSYSFSLDNDITFKILSTNEDLKTLNLKYQKSLFLPTLSGFYKYSDQVNTPDFNTNIKHILGVNLSIPILSSGMRLAKASQASIELDKARNMKDQESQRLILVAEQATFDYTTSLENYYNEKENIELSERVFNNATVRNKEGVFSALDLSLINNQYLQAQLSYASAVQKLLTSKTALDKAYSKL